MFDLDDVELEHSGKAPVMPPPRRPNYTVWAAAVVAAIVVAGGVWYITSRPQPSSPPAVTVADAPPAAVPERPEAPLVKAADIDLPPLPQTDPIVRELVARLSSHPTIAAWLTTKGLIANFTVATLNIAEGRTPAQLLRPIAPQGRFRTTSAGEEVFVDPRSYERYNPHGDAIAALDSVGTASLYLTLKPRITEAYRELGYPEGDFDRVLERAIGLLLQTPGTRREGRAPSQRCDLRVQRPEAGIAVAGAEAASAPGSSQWPGRSRQARGNRGAAQAAAERLRSLT